LVRKPEGKRPLAKQKCIADNIKMDLKGIVCLCESVADSTNSEYGPVVGFYKH
jgi:hypothetical protein